MHGYLVVATGRNQYFASLLSLSASISDLIGDLLQSAQQGGLITSINDSIALNFTMSV